MQDFKEISVKLKNVPKNVFMENVLIMLVTAKMVGLGRFAMLKLVLKNVIISIIYNLISVDIAEKANVFVVNYGLEKLVTLENVKMIALDMEFV
jgi:hypothetical protein